VKMGLEGRVCVWRREGERGLRGEIERRLKWRRKGEWRRERERERSCDDEDKRGFRV
jgi:hypothetical protein